jgi:hypothetical protein
MAFPSGSSSYLPKVSAISGAFLHAEAAAAAAKPWSCLVAVIVGHRRVRANCRRMITVWLKQKQ